MNKKTIGIIGGMGPMATYDLANKIVELTPASSDQDHIHVITDCNTNIPDRTEYILYLQNPQGKTAPADPLPELIKSARLLEKAGADFLIMPCNTAHYFYNDLAESVSIPILNMPEIAAKACREQGISTAAVLATDGTVKSGVYERALAAEGVRAVYPEEEPQKRVMSIIYDYIKAGNYNLEGYPILTITGDLQDQGAEKIILACTELPIAFEKIIGNGLLYFRDQLIQPFLLDATLELAKAAVARALE